MSSPTTSIAEDEIKAPRNATEFLGSEDSWSSEESDPSDLEDWLDGKYIMV